MRVFIWWTLAGADMSEKPAKTPEELDEEELREVEGKVKLDVNNNSHNSRNSKRSSSTRTKIGVGVGVGARVG